MDLSPVPTAPKTTLLLSLREQQCLHSCGPKLVHTPGRSMSREISPKSSRCGGPCLRGSRTRHSFPEFSSCSRLEKRSLLPGQSSVFTDDSPGVSAAALDPRRQAGWGGSSGLCRGWPRNQGSRQDASRQEDTQIESIISITVYP